MAGGPMANPMAAMVAMQMAQHPQGPNIGGPTNIGPGDATGGTANEAVQANGTPNPNILAEMAQAARGQQAGNPETGAQLVAAIQKLFPKLRVADHSNGVFELTGPAQDQFLASVYARHHGAKQHSVHNAGKGQRLHVAMP